MEPVGEFELMGTQAASGGVFDFRTLVTGLVRRLAPGRVGNLRGAPSDRVLSWEG